MRFTKDSGLVKVWARQVTNGTYTRDQVPEMFNLREVVYQVLDDMAAEPAA